MNIDTIARVVREHIWGPVGSVCFHVLLFLFLVAWSGHQPARAWRDEPSLTLMPVAATDLALDPPLMAPPVPRFEIIQTAEPVSPADPGEFVDVAGPAMPDGGVSAVEGVSHGLDVAAEKSVLNIDLAVLDLPGLIGERVRQVAGATRPAGRAPASPADNVASGDAAERSIRGALVWLKKHQAEDGSWGPNRIAMTGLALLAYLGHGDTSGSREFGVTVRRAIDFLAGHQQPDGRFATGGSLSQPSVYEHAIATYAISEAYGMTRRPDLKEKMERAAALIVAGQQAGGLWDYEYKKGERWDTSVAGWQVQALKAASINRAEVEGLSGAIARASAGLQAAQARDTGRFGYAQTGQGNIGMTGIGALCLQLAGDAPPERVRAGLLVLREVDCDWQRPERWPLYTWYYVTQALYHDQGPAWNAWGRKLLRAYAKYQNEDGSWTSPPGSGGENEETRHGPVYATTLATLALEAPYRYAPVSQSMHDRKRDETREGRDEVRVEVI